MIIILSMLVLLLLFTWTCPLGNSPVMDYPSLEMVWVPPYLAASITSSLSYRFLPERIKACCPPAICNLPELSVLLILE